jgi:hypothetical protein
MMLEIQVIAWESHTNVTRLNWSIESKPSPFDNVLIVNTK